MKTDRKPKNFERKIKRRSSLKFLKRIIIDNSNFTKNGNCPADIKRKLTLARNATIRTFVKRKDKSDE